MKKLRTVPLHELLGKCRDRWVLWAIAAWAVAELSAVGWLVLGN